MYWTSVPMFSSVKQATTDFMVPAGKTGWMEGRVTMS
jgi:hypothetical protein